MKKVIRWIVLVWAVLAIPYITEFYGGLWLALIIGLMIDDLRK